MLMTIDNRFVYLNYISPYSRCIFIPDNGAFFVNYVITSAFIGTAAELVRLPELLLYAIKLMLARSAAERTSVRKVSDKLIKLIHLEKLTHMMT